MKIVISTKVLAEKLNEINFEKEYVSSINVWVDHITLTKIKLKRPNDSIDLNIPILKTDKCTTPPVHGYLHCLRQESVRWELIKDLTNAVKEQLIILEITDEGYTNIIFRF